MSDRLHAIKIEKEFKKKTTIKTFRGKKPKASKNSRRQIRRKRSKIRYYKTLKKVRYNQKTQDLCSAVEVFDIADMDWAPASCPPTTLPSDVVEWQRQDQIAYWKSRAISLEFENQMLRQHLRNVYAKTIEDFSVVGNELESEISGEEKVKTNNKTSEKGKEEKEAVVPNLPNHKQRVEEMKNLYGDSAQKLMGMETAIQLNYERHLEQSKPVFWPSLPLNLTF